MRSAQSVSQAASGAASQRASTRGSSARTRSTICSQVLSANARSASGVGGAARQASMQTPVAPSARVPGAHRLDTQRDVR
jgi:hypothetical protein